MSNEDNDCIWCWSGGRAAGRAPPVHDKFRTVVVVFVEVAEGPINLCRAETVGGLEIESDSDLAVIANYFM